MTSVVVAIGGNAILPGGGRGGIEEQGARVEETCRYLARMVQGGLRLTVTHGNGPQVGNLLLQNEAARGAVTPQPLDVLVAESQAQIGYLIQQALGNELLRLGLPGSVITLVTQVVVDPRDEAFQNPSKPIGPYYPEDVARVLMREKGWHMREDKARGGYRRLAASPRPLGIVEKDIIRHILATGSPGDVIIAAGGGGIPVVAHRGGFRGIEAVIDKDLASSVLARDIGTDLFVIITDVPAVALDFGKPTQRFLSSLGAGEAEALLAQGQFPPGSMGPKVEAATRFIRKGGGRAIITDINSLEEAVKGRAGTQLHA